MTLTKYEQIKRYRAKYPERHRKESLAYYYRNKERLREKKKLYAQNGGNLRRYNLSLDSYKLLFKQQGGVCAICGNAETVKLRGVIKKLAVDHNHITGKVRGLLCNHCNRGLGCMKDDVLIFKNAIKYLKKYG